MSLFRICLPLCRSQKLKTDPYTATMGRFSKVTNYIFDNLRGSDPATQQRPPSEMADFFSDAIPGLKINQQEEPGFEVITRVSVLDSEGGFKIKISALVII